MSLFKPVIPSWMALNSGAHPSCHLQALARDPGTSGYQISPSKRNVLTIIIRPMIPIATQSPTQSKVPRSPASPGSCFPVNCLLDFLQCPHTPAECLLLAQSTMARWWRLIPYRWYWKYTRNRSQMNQLRNFATTMPGHGSIDFRSGALGNAVQTLARPEQVGHVQHNG